MMRPLVSLCLVFSLVACSSSSSDKKTSSSNESLENRIMRPDFNKVSRYEKAFNTAGAGDRGQSTFFGRKTVKGSEFGGLKNFKTGSYQTGDFSQSRKTSTFANTKSSFSTKENRMGNSTFKTKASRYDTQSASESSKMFSGANNTVNTRSYQPAEKSLSENKRFVFIGDRNAKREKVAYTEDEVKSMLGR